jgi:hypothetical protein
MGLGKGVMDNGRWSSAGSKIVRPLALGEAELS